MKLIRLSKEEYFSSPNETIAILADKRHTSWIFCALNNDDDWHGPPIFHQDEKLIIEYYVGPIFEYIDTHNILRKHRRVDFRVLEGVLSELLICNYVTPEEDELYWQSLAKSS